MDSAHTEAVQALQRQVKDFYARKVPFRVYHGSTNSTKVLTFKRSEMIDISAMDRVLKIDTERKVAIVEPNVPMDKLVDACLQHGLVPPVVPEFPGITVGGAIQGAAAESASYRYGCFSQTVDWIEIVLGNGQRIKASPTKHANLFYGTAGSYGSLGLITAAAIRLIPAKKYVTVTHYQVDSFQSGLEMAMHYAALGNDFIEWVMFAPDHGAIVVGNMSDEVTGRLRRFSRARDPWYYLYAKDIAASRKTVTDSLPLRDYLFRFDRGAFWAAELAFTQSGVPFNRLTRFLLNPLLKTRKLYQALQDSAAGQTYICQDLVLPKNNVVSFLKFVDKELHLYPIGLCPLKPEPRSPLQCNGIEADMLFNIGVYGLRVDNHDEFVRINQRIEEMTNKLGGKKWFYAHSYYSEHDFWRIYDKKWYDKLRGTYHATNLPDIYSRIRVKETYPVHKRRAVIRTVLGRAKLRIEE